LNIREAEFYVKPNRPNKNNRGPIFNDFFLDKEMNVVYMSKNFRAFPALISHWVAEGRVESVPTLCAQCEIPACRLACPTGATHVGGPAEARVVAAEKCIGCSGCVWACPFGASVLDPVTGVANRCDLCEGDPRCVKHCPTGALTYVPEDQVAGTEQKRKTGVLMDLYRMIRR
jgi:Fe-S-cluster-containing hydrogenase component 2